MASPNERYEYLNVVSDRARTAELRTWLSQSAADAAAAAGGTLWGSWLGAGSIGWYDDEVVVMVHRPEDRSGSGIEWLSAGPGVSSVEAVELRPTARPQEHGQVRPGGVFAHRWFEVEPDRVAEVVALSAEAWPAFESAYEAEIQGLFRTAAAPSRLLLVTRYASVAEWERSRGVGRADAGDLSRSRENFARRRALTGRQVVRIAPLASV